MRNVRRHDPEGRPVFITQVTRHRAPLLAGWEPMLMEILSELRIQFASRIYAHVILPDHLHLIVHGNQPVGPFMQSLKLRAIRRARSGLLWQTRFHDHVIRNDTDLRNHLDYVHYNPVKHGWAKTPEDHRFSSYRRYLARNWYLPGWGHHAPATVADWELE